ncbi:hypothetical protein HOO65_100002 [Ceratocystis lukuohia]|uniref:Retrotransposon gag domain-containing protein n=1 Tax=Ceratocystis lukuohia TaxID=2019550 RepID=A0ABR4M8M4_9PEZI
MPGVTGSASVKPEPPTQDDNVARLLAKIEALEIENKRQIRPIIADIEKYDGKSSFQFKIFLTDIKEKQLHELKARAKVALHMETYYSMKDGKKALKAFYTFLEETFSDPSAQQLALDRASSMKMGRRSMADYISEAEQTFLEANGEEWPVTAPFNSTKVTISDKIAYFEIDVGGFKEKHAAWVIPNLKGDTGGPCGTDNIAKPGDQIFQHVNQLRSSTENDGKTPRPYNNQEHETETHRIKLEQLVNQHNMIRNFKGLGILHLFKGLEEEEFLHAMDVERSDREEAEDETEALGLIRASLDEETLDYVDGAPSAKRCWTMLRMKYKTSTDQQHAKLMEKVFQDMEWKEGDRMFQKVVENPKQVWRNPQLRASPGWNNYRLHDNQAHRSSLGKPPSSEHRDHPRATPEALSKKMDRHHVQNR